MNNNEIMNNEVVEATEEVIENAGLSKGVKIAAGIGLSVVVGVVVYKYVAKKPRSSRRRWLLRRRRLSWKNPMLSLKTTENANLRSSDKGEYL